MLITILDRYRKRNKKSANHSLYLKYILTITLIFYKEDILPISRKIEGIRGIVCNISVIRNRKEEMIIT